MCNGTGVLDRTPRDTLKMKREEFDELLQDTLPTPIPPKLIEPSEEMIVYQPPPLLPQGSRPDLTETLANATWMQKRVKRLRIENTYFFFGALFVLVAVTALVVVTLLPCK
jgi:hypothetical protein